jgi:hypothetical protein
VTISGFCAGSNELRREWIAPLPRLVMRRIVAYNRHNNKKAPAKAPRDGQGQGFYIYATAYYTRCERKRGSFTNDRDDGPSIRRRRIAKRLRR